MSMADTSRAGESSQKKSRGAGFSGSSKKFQNLAFKHGNDYIIQLHLHLDLPLSACLA